MLTRLRVSYAALLLSVAACGGKSAAERVAQHDRVRVSWEQTARFVGAEWSDRALPDAFASRALERASEELQSESNAVSKDSVPSHARATLLDSLSGARALADSLHSAVRASDRNAVSRLVTSSPRPRADSLLRRAALR
jgi:hypothetical protein